MKMKILVLTQVGTPVSAHRLPSRTMADWQIDELKDSIKTDRTALLKDAYLKLHPTSNPNRFEDDCLPPLSVSVLELDDEMDKS